MTALAANKPRASRYLGEFHTLPMVASDIIYQGSLVMVDSAGYAAPAAASLSANRIFGVAVEKVDNSSGAAAAKNIKVQEGTYLFDGTTLAQTVLGDLVYGEDDNSVDETDR